MRVYNLESTLMTIHMNQTTLLDFCLFCHMKLWNLYVLFIKVQHYSTFSPNKRTWSIWCSVFLCVLARNFSLKVWTFVEKNELSASNRANYRFEFDRQIRRLFGFNKFSASFCRFVSVVTRALTRDRFSLRKMHRWITKLQHCQRNY